MNNTKSLMTDVNPKDAIKLATVKLDKTYPEENIVSEDTLVYTDTYINPANNMDTKKDEQQTLSGVNYV